MGGAKKLSMAQAEKQQKMQTEAAAKADQLRIEESRIETQKEIAAIIQILLHSAYIGRLDQIG